MNLLTDPTRRHVMPIAFGVLALALHLWGLDSKSLWGDEASTAWHSGFSAWTLWTQPITHKPPLYYLLTSWFWSPGDSEFALRLPAALLGSLTVGLGWLLGYRLGDRHTAFWLALFLLLSDINLHYSQEARHYILLTLGWLLLILAALRLVQADTGHSLPAFALWLAGALLMVHAHPAGNIYLLGSQLAFCLAVILQRPIPWRPLTITALLSLGAGLTLLPWWRVALANASGSFNWLQQPSIAQALLEWVSLFGARSLVHLGGPPLALGVGAALALLSMAGLLLYWRHDRVRGALLLGLMLLPPLILWLIGLVKPVYMLRTISPTHLLAMAGLALAVGRLDSQRLRLGAALILTLTLATSSWAWRTNYQKEAWRDLSKQLREHARGGDIVLVCENQLYRPLWFYLGEQMPRVMYLDRRHRRLWQWDAEAARWKPFHPAPGERPPETFWVADRLGHCPHGIDRILYHFTGLRYQSYNRWRGRALTLMSWRRAR